MTIESQMKICKTTVMRPITTQYGAETERTNQLLRTTEMKTFRSAIGVTLWHRMRNKDVRDQCNIQDINKWIRVRPKEWSNHVDRASEERLMRKARVEKPAAVRPRGRPPKRWPESWESSSTETWGTVKKDRLIAYNKIKRRRRL